MRDCEVPTFSPRMEMCDHYCSFDLIYIGQSASIPINHILDVIAAVAVFPIVQITFFINIVFPNGTM